MTQVVISNIDDDVVERLKARAAAEKKSLEQKLRDVLTEAAKPSRAEVLAEVDMKILCKTSLQFGKSSCFMRGFPLLPGKSTPPVHRFPKLATAPAALLP